MSAQPGGDVRVAMAFETTTRRATNADTPRGAAAGPAAGQGGDFADRFSVRSADGRRVAGHARPATRFRDSYVLSDLSTGPVLFASLTCWRSPRPELPNSWLPRRPASAEAAQPQAVGDHEHARERHGGAGDHRVEQAGGRQRQRRHVVGEGPEQVALDRARACAATAGPRRPRPAGRRAPASGRRPRSPRRCRCPSPGPRSACARAAASLTPSPTIATTRPSRLQPLDHVDLAGRAAPRRPPRRCRPRRRPRGPRARCRRSAGPGRARAPRSRAHGLGARSASRCRRRPARPRARAVPADHDGGAPRGLGRRPRPRRARRAATPAREQPGRPTTTHGPRRVPRTPSPPTAREGRPPPASERRRRPPRRSARATGCSEAASTRRGQAAYLVDADSPVAGDHVDERHPAGGDGAGLVEHDGVDAAGRPRAPRAPGSGCRAGRRGRCRPSARSAWPGPARRGRR